MNYLVVHCSDSPQGRGDTAETIHRWHRARGWDGIGYHHVILEDGTVENGRPHYWSGAHVGGHNIGSLGICLIGRDTFTKEQMDSLRELLKTLHGLYPNAVIVGHGDLDNRKTCPNFNVRDLVEEVLHAA